MFLREETPKVNEDPKAEEKERQHTDRRERPESSSLVVPCRGKPGSNKLPGLHPPHVAIPGKCTSEPERNTDIMQGHKDNSAHLKRFRTTM